MDVHILNAGDLFNKKVRYVVPEFQRRYVWCKDEQWDLFWEDVCSVAESYLAKRASLGDELKAQTETKPHFLGAIIIQQQPTTSKEPDKRVVVDGQQRLTTLQLLLDAIQWVCQGYGQPYFEDHAKNLSEFVINNNCKAEHIFKLWPSETDQEAFEHVMDNKLPVGDFKGSRIAQAHEFFQQEVTKWLKDGPQEQIEDRIDALVEVVTTRLQIAVIDLDQQADPHIIFETLNARGTPLAQFELIKNFVVFKAQKPSSEIWGELDDDWWKDEVHQGRLDRPRLDMLFNYWLEAHSTLEVKPERVFKAFEEYVNEREIGQVMSEVRQDFGKYREYKKEKGRNPTEKSFHYHIDVMKADVITPVLLLLLSDTTEANKRAFGILESFLIRRMICRYTARGYSGLVMKLIKQLHGDGLDNSDVVIAKCLREEEASTTKWPSDKDMEYELIKSELYGRLTQGRLRLVLEGIEYQLRDSEKTDDPEIPKYLTIEHIMPVSWSEDRWPRSNGIDKDERNTFINTIGNLTLVTQPLNSSMSNEKWERKREELQKYSLLMLNKQWASQSSWSEKDIENRSRRMAELISKRWPGPDSQA